MEAKGFIRSDGRVVWDKDDPAVVAWIGYKEARYNLRRVIVTREWVAGRLGSPAVVWSGNTRREVIASVLAEGDYER